MKALGLYGAEDADPGEAQEYLMEYRDFLRDGEVMQSVTHELAWTLALARRSPRP